MKARSCIASACLLAAMTGTTACRRAEPAPAVDEALASYPPGSWRLARHELPNVLLTVSHILVTHAGAQPQKVTSIAQGWPLEVPKSTRTRPQAFERAAEIVREARRDPANFATLARAYSEDLGTRDQGGSLGTVRASLLPDAFLDALTAMKPGEVSRVVETDAGVHVLQRRPTPSEVTVSADQIVIAYRGVPTQELRAGREAVRSRSDARALALRVAALARRDPSAFPSLVAEHSDHVSALRGGDMGVWSTHITSSEALKYDAQIPREVEAIAGLDLGQISDPLDSAIGYKILRRKAVSSRETLAAALLIVSYVGNEQAPTKSAAEAIARSGRQQIEHDPGKWLELRKAHCCSTDLQWPVGHGDPVVEQVLQRLQVGEKSEPFAAQGAFNIVERLAPSRREPQQPRFELPKSAEPDLDAMVQYADAEVLSDYLGQLEQVLDDFAKSGRLEPEQLGMVKAEFSSLREGFRAQAPLQRLQAMSKWRASATELLGEAGYRQLRYKLMERIITDLAPELAAQMASPTPQKAR